MEEEAFGNIFPEDIIRCVDLYKEYELGDYIISAVENISLNIKRHDLLAIEGSSGAGKTTLLQMIAGLELPTKGDIYIEWVKISNLNEEFMTLFRILNIGFIFQSFNLISSLTAEENIEFPMQLAGLEEKTRKERVKYLLERVKLDERNDHLPIQLSAGEQQRVGIARALANDPPIIIADEPTANLDKKSSDIITNLFLELSEEGKTIIIATHDDKILQSAYRIVSMEDGKIVKEKINREPPSFKGKQVKKVQIPKQIENLKRKNNNFRDLED
ncbi:MAG: ABC transporter ATP-binding protein [Promethearchaeota archaeon]